MMPAKRPPSSKVTTLASVPDPAPQQRSPFAELVREIRRSKGLSQIEVARRGGLGRGYLGMIETGARGERPSRDSVLRVANGLGATDEELEALLRSAGYPPLARDLLDGMALTVEEAIKADPKLREDHRRILLATYRALRDTPH